MDEKSFTVTFTDVEINEDVLQKITGIDTKISTKEVQKITEEIEQLYAERLMQAHTTIKGLEKEVQRLQKHLTFTQGENAGLRFALRSKYKDVES